MNLRELSTIARDAIRRAEAAQNEPLEHQARDWLRFVRAQPDEPIEMQAFEVPRGHRTATEVTYARGATGVANCLAEADGFGAQGLYYMMNPIHPAIATRIDPDEWSEIRSGKGTTDSDIVSRQVLYIDVDAKRPPGTSATDEELHCALAVAGTVYDRLADILGGEEALGFGMSGNGAAVMVAVDALPNTPETTNLVRGILTAISQMYSTESATVDVSVSDARRLCPAWGTMKRKGGASHTERPHRRTAVTCSETVRPLPLSEVEQLLSVLVADLNDDQRVAVDKAMKKPRNNKRLRGRSLRWRVRSASGPSTTARSRGPTNAMSEKSPSTSACWRATTCGALAAIAEATAPSRS